MKTISTIRRPTAAFLLAICLSIPAGLSASAQEDDGRFTLQPSGDGFVRLDRKTGEMSYCRLQEEQLVCRLAADERSAYEKEIARLEDELRALKPETEQGDGGTSTSPDNSEREFEKAMDYAERAMQRFVDMMQRLRDQMETDKPAE